jgi:hypothetical protein
VTWCCIQSLTSVAQRFMTDLIETLRTFQDAVIGYLRTQERNAALASAIGANVNSRDVFGGGRRFRTMISFLER